MSLSSSTTDNSSGSPAQSMSVPNDEDIDSIQQGFSSRQLRIKRMVRWCDEAFDQGALLSQLDLAVLLNCRDAVVSDYQQTLDSQWTISYTSAALQDPS